MRILSALLLTTALSFTPLYAQANADAEKADLVEKILTLRELEAFQKALDEAKKKKVSDQILFEAQFLYSIDEGDFAAIVKLKDQALALSENFKAQNSEVFASTEDWLAVVNFIQALEALEKGNDEDFQKFIKQAYWLSPAQAPAFNPHIEKFKVSKLKASYILPPETSFSQQGKKEKITFKKLTESHDGVVLYAYSPWSRESAMAAETLNEFHAVCEKLKVSHLQHNIEDPIDSAESNKEYVELAKAKSANYWTHAEKGHAFIEALRIKTTPTVIHFDKEGKILFHGSPQEFIKVQK